MSDFTLPGDFAYNRGLIDDPRPSLEALRDEVE